MKTLQFYISYHGKEYPLDMIDFVNERVAFRYVDEEMKPQGAHVDMNKYDILVK